MNSERSGVTRTTTKHGRNWLLPAKTKVRLRAASNLPPDSDIQWWARAARGETWPDGLAQWAEGPGVGLSDFDVILDPLDEPEPVEDEAEDTEEKDIDGKSSEEWAEEAFEFELCDECEKDADEHTYELLLGHWFARCKDDTNKD